MLSCAGKNGVWEGVGGVGEHTGTRGRNRAPACPPPPSLTSMHPRDRAHASAGRRGHAGGVRAGGKRGLEACPLPGRSPGGVGAGGAWRAIESWSGGDRATDQSTSSTNGMPALLVHKPTCNAYGGQS